MGKIKYWLAKILFIVGFRKYIGADECDEPSFVALFDWQEKWLNKP